MAFFVVVLGQLLAQLGRRDAHDGVGTGVVVHLSTKDRDAQSPLFGWPIVSTVQRLLNDELEEDTEPLAQSKKWMGEWPGGLPRRLLLTVMSATLAFSAPTILHTAVWHPFRL